MLAAIVITEMSVLALKQHDQNTNVMGFRGKYILSIIWIHKTWFACFELRLNIPLTDS